MFRINQMIAAALLLLAVNLNAQKTPDWTLPYDNDAQQIFFQPVTGTPILQTDKAYIAINPETRQVAWTSPRYTGKIKSIGGALDQAGSDFESMIGAPFVIVQNNVLESVSGKAVISKDAQDYKSINDYEIIPDLNAVLVSVTAKGNMLRLYLISLQDGKLLWENNIAKLPQIEAIPISDDQPEIDRLDVPMYTSLVTADKHLVYHFKKNLAVINPEGKLLWTEKEDAAEFTLSPDEKMILVVKPLMTGVGNSPVRYRNQTIFRSNKVVAIDLKTGKPAWKKDIKADQNIRWIDAHPDFFTVAARKSCNIYRYSTGESIWEDDFKGKRICGIEPNAAGYLVKFESGFKSMQLNAKGKPVWKEPKEEAFESDDDDEDDEDIRMDIFQYKNGKVLITPKKVKFRPAKGSGMKRWRMNLDTRSRIAYDPMLNNLVVLNDNTIYVVNPDQQPKVAKKYTTTNNYIADFQVVEFRESGYFLSGPQTCAFLDPAAETIEYRHFDRPYDQREFLLGVLQAGLAVGGVIMLNDADYTRQEGQEKRTQAKAGFLPPGSGNSEIRQSTRKHVTGVLMLTGSALVPEARLNTTRQTSHYAWYFSTGKDGNVLVKIDKDNGRESNRFKVEGSRPVYQIDEVQPRLFLADKGKLKVFELTE